MTDLKRGDYVAHSLYGTGQVSSVSPEGVKVVFDLDSGGQFLVELDPSALHGAERDAPPK